MSTARYAHGQHFIIEPTGTALTDDERRILKDLRPAGVMFRKRNFLPDKPYQEWLATHKKLLSEIREIVGRENLIVCIDHEGGQIVRPPAPITRFPYPARWAGRTKLVTEAMAIELRSLGINLSFAPVADIHSNPDNPVINERAFGRTAAEASQGALECARILESHKVLPCAKHFPGHGDTKTDSHYDLPILDASLDDLRVRELVPFKTLIDAGCDFVMTAHLLFPKIDRNEMATTSERLLKNLLRDEMGFNGVIVADALGMKAISERLGSEKFVLQAVRATLDLFLVVGPTVTMQHAVMLAEQLEEAARRDTTIADLLAASSARIDAACKKLTVHEVRALDTEVFVRHAALATELQQQTAWSGFTFHAEEFG